MGGSGGGGVLVTKKNVDGEKPFNSRKVNKPGIETSSLPSKVKKKKSKNANSSRHFIGRNKTRKIQRLQHQFFKTKHNYTNIKPPPTKEK